MKNNRINSFEGLASVMGISKEEIQKSAEMQEMWTRHTPREEREDYVYVPRSVDKKDKALFISCSKIYAAVIGDEDANDAYKVYAVSTDAGCKVFYKEADREVSDDCICLAECEKASAKVFTTLLRDTKMDQARSTRIMEQIMKAYEERNTFRTSTTTRVEGGRVETTTVSSAPVKMDAPVVVEHEFTPDESGRLVETNIESAEDVETGISESAPATEAVPADSSAVDERIKQAKAEQLKVAKANAKAIEESEKMTADIMAQVAEVRRMLEEAKEAKRLEEERRAAEERERQTLAEVEAINKATEESKAQTDAALAEQRKQQEDALRMILEMKKELESLKA